MPAARGEQGRRSIPGMTDTTEPAEPPLTELGLSAGRALLDGSPIEGPGPDRAVLFQDPALFPWLSVRANVELALELIAVGGVDRRDRAQTALASVGLADVADAQPHELSAGMRQ